MTSLDRCQRKLPLQSKKFAKLFLPAAGLGTRFLPATKAQPKEMLNVVDKPQIQYVVEECVASGIEHIIIVTGKGKNSIEDHFDYNPTLERFLEEKGKHGSSGDGAATSATWCRSATRGRKSRWDWATRCWWQRIW